MQAIVEAALASVTIASQSVPDSIDRQAGLAPSTNAYLSGLPSRVARHYWAPSLPSLAKEGKPNFQSLSIRNLAGAGKKAEKHALLPFW